MLKLRGFDPIDEKSEKMLESIGMRNEKAEACIKCDILPSGIYGDVWMVACADGIYTCDENSVCAFYAYSDFKEIEVENYVSSGCIVLFYENGEDVLSSFSLSCAAKVEAFIAIVKKLKSSVKLEASDFLPPRSDEGTYINQGRKKLFIRVLGYMPKYKKGMIMIVLLIVLSSLVNMVQPYLTGNILYDEVLSPAGRFNGMIFPFVAVLIFLNAISVLLNILHGRIGADVSCRIVYDIKSEVFESMQKLGMKFFTSKRTGNLMNRINSDALDLQYFLNDGMPQFLINTLTICGVGLVLFIKNPLLSVSVLIPVPLIAYIIKVSARKFKKLKWYTWRKSSSLNSLINDSLMGIRVVKAFGREDDEISRFSYASNQLYETKLREGIASAKIFPFINWIMTLGGLIVWGLGGTQVLGGKLTFGELMTFVGYLSLLYNPIKSMVRTFDWWTTCMNSAQRIFEVIDRDVDIPEPENPVKTDKINGDIELKNVTFSYEPNREVLKNVSFKAHCGEMIGLVGHSGAGKSTITNLITRLYDVRDGEVLIDGYNVKNISSDMLRSSIGMVLQETFLFDGTIAENIAYGRPEASIEEIIDAAKNANAHDFIMKLPDAYETVIGSHGLNISGGEKQRISIARAILMDPSILILDEATSSLDTETERKIQQALERLVKGRTTIAIAHRLSTLRNADRLVVIEHGKVIETGTHEELFKKEHGVYRKMALQQIRAIQMRSSEGGDTV